MYKLGVNSGHKSMLRVSSAASFVVAVVLFWPSHYLHNAVVDSSAALSAIENYPPLFNSSIDREACASQPAAQQCCNTTDLKFIHLESEDRTADNVYYLTTVLAALALLGVLAPVPNLSYVLCAAFIAVTVFAIVLMSMAYDMVTSNCDDFAAETATEKLAYLFDVNWVGEHPMQPAAVRYAQCVAALPFFERPVFKAGFLAPQRAALQSACDAGQSLVASYLTGLAILLLISGGSLVIDCFARRSADSSQLRPARTILLSNPVYVDGI